MAQKKIRSMGSLQQTQIPSPTTTKPTHRRRKRRRMRLGNGERTRRRPWPWTALSVTMNQEIVPSTTESCGRRKHCERFFVGCLIILLSVWCSATTPSCHALVPSPLLARHVGQNMASSSSSSTTSTAIHAKRSKKQQSRQEMEDLNHWYQAVDAAATPDDVFWEEMERQRLLAEVGTGGGGSSGSTVGSGTASLLEERGVLSSSSSSSTATSVASAAAAAASLSSSSSMLNPNSNSGGGRGLSSSYSAAAAAAARGNTPKSAEATLTEYTSFMVSDNWLDEDLAALMEVMEEEEEVVGLSSDTEDQSRRLEEQLMEMENEDVEEGDVDNDDDDDEDDGDDDTNAWMQSDEPWDNWGDTPEEAEDRYIFKIDRTKASEFLYNDDEDDEEDTARQEEEFLQRIARLSIRSPRLEKARDNPKAKAFFSRDPNALEGFDRMWIAAIDNVCFKSLVGGFRDYGVQFADNFGDWENTCIEDLAAYTIEDVASYKAREVFKATGLPCIASRTSFEIEPIPITPSRFGRPGSSIMTANPRVVSGYRFNDIGMHVDYMLDALRPLSEPTRVTRFKSCLCYYDGELEVFDYGCADVDIHFANSLRTFIPMAAAITEMVKTLQLTFGLEYQSWLKQRLDMVALGSSGYGSASVKLRDRVLKEGKVLPNDIVDVSAFMDSMVDVELMDVCAKELSNRFMDYKPTKLLTVATTGLVIALPMAKYLQVPLVYARKERNMVMADTYKAAYSSKTVGKNRELLVSKSHLHMEDRVLIVDDFLSGGSSQEALLRIVSDAGATAVGVACLLEKVYDSGRRALSGFNVPIQSLCRIASVKDGVIQLVEEDGFDRM